MHSKLVNIIEKFRDEDSPVMCVTDDNVQLETFSKAQIINEFGKIWVHALRLCRLGSIDPRPEIMCGLLHDALRFYRTKRKDEWGGAIS